MGYFTGDRNFLLYNMIAEAENLVEDSILCFGGKNLAFVYLASPGFPHLYTLGSIRMSRESFITLFIQGMMQIFHLTRGRPRHQPCHKLFGHERSISSHMST